MSYSPKIGLEVHVQLTTASKLFCSCPTAIDALPNTTTCPVCLGLPGALPVPNQNAVGMAVKLALALNCEISEFTGFDRKNYFYPDLPKGYQVTQFVSPIGSNGRINISTDCGEEKEVKINRLHLEEDAAKSIHRSDETLIDFNRSGIPLVEIVTAPDLKSSREAYNFVKEIRRLVRWLEVSSGNMEEGNLRCDANISLSDGNKTGIPVELKNLNSIRGIENALKFEISRQAEMLKNGKPVTRETRSWDERNRETFPMRSKEQLHDYRYFPDPDLPGFEIARELVKEQRESLPELPGDREKRFIEQMDMRRIDAEVILSDRIIADYFEDVYNKCFDLTLTTRWLLGEVLRWRNDAGQGEDITVPAESTAKLILLEKTGKVSSASARRIYEIMAKENFTEPGAIAERENLLNSIEIEDLEQTVNHVVRNNSETVRRYRQGYVKLFNLFMGQVMKATDGKADPEQARKLLLKALQQEES